MALSKRRLLEEVAKGRDKVRGYLLDPELQDPKVVEYHFRKLDEMLVYYINVLNSQRP